MSMIRFVLPRRAVRPLAAAVGLLVLVAGGCTSVQRQGVSPSYLIIESLEAASGADPTLYSNFLLSDVFTLVNVEGARVPTIFNDNGRVNLSLALKDPGSSTSATQPSPTNTITVNRYHVTFVRADGRNTPGVDVPYPFDGALTVSVGVGGAQGVFELVRHQAKEEAPLAALQGFGGAIAISTIAEVTFYGTDQAGRAVSVTGKISVGFGDFADPAK